MLLKLTPGEGVLFYLRHGSTSNDVTPIVKVIINKIEIRKGTKEAVEVFDTQHNLSVE